MTYKHGILVNGEQVQLWSWLNNNKNNAVILQFVDIAMWIPPLRRLIDKAGDKPSIKYSYGATCKIPKRFQDYPAMNSLSLIGFLYKEIYRFVLVNPFVRTHLNSPWTLIDDLGNKCKCSLPGTPQLRCDVHHFLVPTHDIICPCLEEDKSYYDRYYDYSAGVWEELDLDYPIIYADKKEEESKRYALIDKKAIPRKKK